MKKQIFSNLLFIGITSIALIACSKKETVNTLPQLLTIKATTNTNGYFSINTPGGFMFNVDDPTLTTGSTGNIYKYGNTIGDSIKINFTFGGGYGGPTALDDLAVKNFHMNDSILTIEHPLITNFGNNTSLITYYAGYFPTKDTTDIRVQLCAFDFGDNPYAKLQLYSQYAHKKDQLETMKNMMKSSKYIK